jgi:DNA-binding Lrp family transcriptional regulator
MKKKQYTGVWIPKEILNIDAKNGNEKILMAMIFNLSEKNPCTASNKYFAERLNLSISQVNRMINNLKQLGYIHKSTFNNKREIIVDNSLLICINADTQYADMHTPVRINADTQYADMHINTKEDNININTSTTAEKIKSNLDLVENVCKEKNIDKEVLYNQIEVFSKRNKVTKKIYPNDTELFKHFLNWIDTYKPKEKINIEDPEKIEKVLDWFIDSFNKITKGSFIVKPNYKPMIAKLIQNGYKGNDFKKAIENLRSYKSSNYFHINNGFKIATPEYLLKDNNFEKYLNTKHKDF